MTTTDELPDTDAVPDAVPDAATLSTQPLPPGARPALRRNALAPVRRAWRRLVSMRTALVLLFLLALAAVPGSLLPQRPLNPIKVDDYLTAHRTLGPVYDRLGLFDVFAAPWFAAIYLLLFTSLVGCLVPRIRLHARALRAAPPPAPARFDRLPESTRVEVAGSPEQVAARMRAALRRGRWRVVTRARPGTIAVSAEKGYLRETGNLVFHVALTVLLLGVAVGKLWGYQGTVLVEEGKGFCNAVLQYDAFRPGREVKGDALAPFCITLDRFTATYSASGTPTLYRADIRYARGGASPEHHYRLEVNSPLRISGVRLYLINHGFSPRFTVRTPSGQVFAGVTTPFVPQDGNLTSEGVLKLPDARPDQLAVDGLFAPTAVDAGNGVITSASARPLNPMVAIFLYRGNLGLDSGEPQSVYSLDQRQIQRGELTRVAAKNLRPGQSLTLADGTSVRFDGYLQWASLQVSRDPGQRVVLIAAGLIVLGL
ncbi:MAG TPA: cytochrome c biogenesis protein ResB, partial [Mycobacteriales bacterium]|nr:cytochrome c biogenesis protein ResB [Mycobacteriales bacterium]